MEKILLRIKHNFKFLWKIIEKTNDHIFNLIFGNKLRKNTCQLINKDFKSGYDFRELYKEDIGKLHSLIASQPADDLKYFHPHEFDLRSIKAQFSKHSFLMLGVFIKGKLIGYFFLRFFVNKKCFVGRLIDKDYRGKGIGPIMNEIMYSIALKMNFRCLSTISKNNTAIMKAHQKNNRMIILRELDNDYLLVEFTQN